MKARAPAGALFGLLLTAGCSTAPTPPGAVSLVLGGETDTWATSGAVRVELVRRGSDGDEVVSSSAAVPPPALDVGPTDRVDTVFYEARGIAADGRVVVAGRTPPLAPLDLSGASVPLWVGRSGAFGRAPGLLDHPHASPEVGTALSRYLVVAGGTTDADVPDLYDTRTWQTLTGQPPLPAAPRTMVALAGVLLLIDAKGAALWYDLSSEQVVAATPPSGLTFAEIAGGAVVQAPDGTTYVVGAGRATSPPSSAVLRVAPDGAVDALTLGTPRLGAAAGWVPGLGLLVAGGSASGSGAEVAQGSTFAPLAYGPDATRGAALVDLGDGHALLVGGIDADGQPAKGRSLDLACASACAFAPAAYADVALATSHGFADTSGVALVVGDALDGATHAWRIDALAQTSVELALRVPRAHASALRTPSGYLAVVGGERLSGAGPAGEIELLVP